MTRLLLAATLLTACNPDPTCLPESHRTCDATVVCSSREQRIEVDRGDANGCHRVVCRCPKEER